MHISISIFIALACSSLAVGVALGANDEVDKVLYCPPKVVLDAGSLESDYLVLESILDEQLKTNQTVKEFESIMKAVELIRQQKHHHQQHPSGDVQKGRQLRKATKKFTKLSASLNNCNFNGYYVLASNYKASLNCPLLRFATTEAISRHGDNCRRTYLDQFRLKHAKLDQSLQIKISQLISGQTLEKLFADQRQATLLTSNSIRDSLRKIGPHLLDNLIQSGGEKKLLMQRKRGPSSAADAADDGEKRLRDKAIERELVKPCKRYVKEFAEIFYPAKLDLALDETKITEFRLDEEPEFLNVWVKFRVCRAIKGDWRYIVNLISEEAKKRRLASK